jgi:rare lipoprotein A
MPDRAERKDDKGLSARFLILVFVMGVAACAVFFSLGFLVGYNERPSRAANTAEEVAPSGAIPPLVNPPPEAAQTVSAPVTLPTAGSELPTGQIATAKPAAKPSPEPAAKPLGPALKPAAKTPAATHRGKEAPGFTVQVAASREKKDAEKLVKELRARGLDVFVVPPQFSDAKDNLYRVQVGPYATRAEAVRVRDRIAKEGFKPFIKN